MSKKGIYKITNARTGKSYIGQSVNIENRWNQHQNKLNSGTHHNNGLQRDWNRGDKFHFQVLEYTPYLDEREKFYINHFNTFHNGYNMTRGGSGVKYSPTYYQEDKSVENFLIACAVFIGVYLLTLYISSFVFRPLGDYNDMILSTIVALFVSIYVILRWKKGFKIGLYKLFARDKKDGGTTIDNSSLNNNISLNHKNHIKHNSDSRYNLVPNNEQNKSISLGTINRYKLKIYSMDDESFRKVIGTIPSAEDSDKWKQINNLFRNMPRADIIKRVDRILIDDIYDNLPKERKIGLHGVSKRDVSKIYNMDNKSFKSLCDVFAVPKDLTKEKQIEYLFNNYSNSEIMQKATEILGENIKKS